MKKTFLCPLGILILSIVLTLWIFARDFYVSIREVDFVVGK